MTQEEQAVYEQQQNQPRPVMPGPEPMPVTEPQPRKSEVAPPPPLIRLTHKQVMENYELLIRNQAYLVLKTGKYYQAGSYGNGTDEQKYAVKHAISVLAGYGSEYLYELVDQDVARDIKARKCSITKLLGQQVVEMLKVAPSNPALLARVLAATGQMPPPCKTYEELKTWVETNCGPKLEPRVAEDCFLRVRFRNEETGHCNYRVENKSVRDYTLQHDLITELAEKCKDWESFMKAVQDHITQNAQRELDPVLEGQGFDYDDYTTDDTTETETTIANQGTMFTALEEIMRRSQPQEILDKLGL